jgi:hypothetical protein
VLLLVIVRRPIVLHFGIVWIRFVSGKKWGFGRKAKPRSPLRNLSQALG